MEIFLGTMMLVHTQDNLHLHIIKANGKMENKLVKFINDMWLPLLVNLQYLFSYF